jgi:cell wall-associated NlpC family hydrolase
MPYDPATEGSAAGSPIQALVSFLLQQVGHPYVRGMTGQNGAFDCSGLATAAYRSLGI